MIVPEDPVLLGKVVNALIPTAGSTTRGILGLRAVIEVFRKGYGGLWVGGRVRVTARDLTFAPNALNAGVHSGDLEVRLPLGTIQEVRREFGVGTGIVVVEHGAGEFRFRCWGASGTADRLREIVAGARTVER